MYTEWSLDTLPVWVGSAGWVSVGKANRLSSGNLLPLFRTNCWSSCDANKSPIGGVIDAFIGDFEVGAIVFEVGAVVVAVEVEVGTP